jgi:lipid-binding SYLF domain-containing protein
LKEAPHLKEQAHVILKRLCLAAAVAGAVWAAPLGAAGWNPQGQTEQLEAAQQTVAEFKRQDSSLGPFFQKAYGYAVFPTIGKGGFWIGGAFGRGIVYEKDTPVGRTSVTQVSFGFLIGAQTYSELLFFRDKAALDRFKKGNAEFSAQATAVIARQGVAATTSYDATGLAVFLHIKGGAMAEASVAGQTFSYEPGMSD